jgi:DNA end-binding protein Ku
VRSIWSGSINFGLINIPVKLYPATQEKNIDFDYLHKKDLSPVRYAKVCEKEEKEISYKDLVRGYEYREGDYIVITDEDIDSASPEQTKSIQIISFAKEADIDTQYFETPYYLEPEKNSKKAYSLLLEALRETQTVAVASFILRTRETLAVLKPHKNLLILNRIRFYEEIRSHKELNIPKEEAVTKTELDMAVTLIKKQTKKFEPEEYDDTYREKLVKMIEAKAKGKKLPKAKAVKQTHVQDLMSLLKESLEHEGAGA